MRHLLGVPIYLLGQKFLLIVFPVGVELLYYYFHHLREL